MNEMTVIVALLLSQFDLALTTPKPRAECGSGATRPSATLIRYRRRAAAERDPATLTAASGCPHLQAGA